METVKPRRRLRADNAQSRDKYNLSNDHLYEVAKEGGRHRVRQTFGQLVVEHAYPAQKLQLPFVSLSRVFIMGYCHTLSPSVQNPTFQSGSTLFPPTSFAVPYQYRNTLQQSADCEEEKGQSRTQGRQGRQYRRRAPQDQRSDTQGYQQLYSLGILGEFLWLFFQLEYRLTRLTIL